MIKKVYVIVRSRGWRDAFLLNQEIAKNEEQVQAEIERRYPWIKKQGYDHEVK